MKLALFCDWHLPSQRGIQWDYLAAALAQLEKGGADVLFTVGDVTSFGEYDAFSQYLSIKAPCPHHVLLGNSDVRDSAARPSFLRHSAAVTVKDGERTLLGISTPAGAIRKEDRPRLAALRDGDVLLLHHSPKALEENSRRFLHSLTEDRVLTVIHAHSHIFRDGTLGRSRVISLDAQDPDKNIGRAPSFTYYDTETGALEAVPLCLVSRPWALYPHLGISCADNRRDLAYAIGEGIAAVELRYGDDCGEALLPLIEEWRRKTGGYLSLHAPNVVAQNGEILGRERFFEAVAFAKRIGAKGVTVHPPRGTLAEVLTLREAFVSLYAEAVVSLGKGVSVCLENLHMTPSDTPDARGFGYIPEELLAFREEVAARAGIPMAFTLDVGHARNNGIFAQRYPLSRWYELLGREAGAYHLHQTVRREGELSNHRAIESWFGPMINFSSFLYAWEKGILRKAPVFLEVKGASPFETSRLAFRADFGGEARK